MKIVGFLRNVFKDEKSGKDVKYGRVYIAEPIKENGYGVNIQICKADYDYIGTLKPDILNRDCQVYFDMHGKVQLIQMLDK